MSVANASRSLADKNRNEPTFHPSDDFEAWAFAQAKQHQEPEQREGSDHE